MRFPLASLFFLIGSFIFFVIWAFGSFMLDFTVDALTPTAPAQALYMINLLQTAFGIMSALFFIVGVVLIFILDAMSDEPEIFWRQY